MLTIVRQSKYAAIHTPQLSTVGFLELNSLLKYL